MIPSDSERRNQEISGLRTQLVELIVNQSNIFTNWIKFAITVQGGLAAGLGVVLGWGVLSKYRPLGSIIACFGIAAAALFAKILIRHVQWTMWYVLRCNKLADLPELFPSKPGDIPHIRLSHLIWEVLWHWRRPCEWNDLGPVIRSVLIFLLAVVIGWGFILVWLLLWPSP
jgi:hypothetical protein